MAFDELQQHVETFLGCQVGVELIVGLVGSFEARENLDDSLHDYSLPEARRAHQEPLAASSREQAASNARLPASTSADVELGINHERERSSRMRWARKVTVRTSIDIATLSVEGKVRSRLGSRHEPERVRATGLERGDGLPKPTTRHGQPRQRDRSVVAHGHSRKNNDGGDAGDHSHPGGDLQWTDNASNPERHVPG
jgi:hypothetical protein